MTDHHPAPAIRTSGLSRRYGKHLALDDLTLAVPTGAIYGFLGPNGAGKTTTIRILLGFIRPSSRAAALFGRDCWSDGVAARASVGFLVAADALYLDLTGTALLDHAAALSGAPPVLRDRLLDALELGRDALGRRISTYSKGMKQKVALIAAMQHDPALLILDEPSDGLDPLIQRNFEQVLREANRRGATVFMSSHDLPEVERLCERVAIVRGGRLIAEETIASLARRHRRQATVLFNGPVPAALAAAPGIRLVASDGVRADLEIDGEIGPLLSLLASLDVADLLLPPPRLEDIFMGFYGEEATA
ncbi:MAG: ABC transporter ATP-binding protein [Chloroflexota bacterium]